MKKLLSPLVIVLLCAALLPLLELFFPASGFTDRMRPILIFALLGLGLNVVTGFCGLLNLGVAAFMAAGAYSFAVVTVEVYPFQIGFWGGLLVSIFVGAALGLVLGLPTLRLRGDYLAIVTLGFGEIMQDVLRNLEPITKGSQGLNPLPRPVLTGVELGPDRTLLWYYFLLSLVTLVAWGLRNLENSRFGRAWRAVRDDELAAGCMAVPVVRSKLLAFSLGAALASASGALWASFLGSTGEPGNFDFQLSVVALCIVIVGGLGSVAGVLLGAFIMVGLNSIVLVELAKLFSEGGLIEGQASGAANVFLSPGNWKFFLFGLALVKPSTHHHQSKHRREPRNRQISAATLWRCLKANRSA